MAEAQQGMIGESHNIARALIQNTVSVIAAAKNVPVDAQYCQYLGGILLERFAIRDAGLSNLGNPGLPERLMCEIDENLDWRLHYRIYDELKQRQAEAGAQRIEATCYLDAMSAAVLETYRRRTAGTVLVHWPDSAELVQEFMASAVPVGPIVTHLAWGRLCTTYWLGGVLHRDPGEGPAIMSHHGDGSLDYEQFWVAGEEIAHPFGLGATT